MFDDTMDQNDSGLLEITRRLEAYADLRLGPSAAATTTMRASVMNAAHRRAALIAADRAREAAAARTIPAGVGERPASRRLYRPAAAFMAASLAIAMLAGTAYGAKAGGPFYAARLWAEVANLPAGLVPRAQAESVRLDRRMAEVQQASADGDAPAAEAALGAYSVIVAEAVVGAAGDPTASATIEISVSRHVVVLTNLAGTVPAQARAAIQDALVSSSKAIDGLDGQSNRGDAGHPSGRDTRRGGPGWDSKGSPRPKPAAQPEPAAGSGGNGTTTVPPTNVTSARDHDSPPPGQSRGGGPTARPARPSLGPDPSVVPGPPGQGEETPAP
jgi:hypothetical protein